MRVHWKNRTQLGEIASWAGDGNADVIASDDSKRGFGTEGDDRRGPAVLMRFANGLTEWAPIWEVEPIQ